jgi:hypothetical protein
MCQEQHRNPQEADRPKGEAGDPAEVFDASKVAEDVTDEEPILVKRTPRLRSGKHEEPETPE